MILISWWSYFSYVTKVFMEFVLMAKKEMNLDAHVTATQFRARIYFVNYFLVDLCLSFPKEIVYHVSESQSGSFLIVSHWCIEIFISNYLSVLWSIKDSNLQFSSLSPGNTLHRYLKQISSLSKIFTYCFISPSFKFVVQRWKYDSISWH